MSDLIDRQAAIDALWERYTALDIIYVDWIVALLANLPSAEQERKKGKWIDGKPYVNSHWRVCSVCHETAPDSAGGYNFCPHCGADMR